jgi:hypothetical protein
VVTTKKITGQPEFTLQLRNWNTARQIDTAQFTFFSSRRGRKEARSRLGHGQCPRGLDPQRNVSSPMLMLRKCLLFVFAVGFFVQGDPVSFVLTDSWTSRAQAIIGRPATPASAGGVARRTTRRCVAGAYRC